jgi:hypothetical protein
MVSLPSAERLNRLLKYDRETGKMYWRERGPGVNKDMLAGISSRGYIVVRIDGILFRAHRIIWKMVTGREPLDQIDHVDGDRANNSWLNLREADNSENNRNRGLQSNNTSGFKGVSFDPHPSTPNKWRARIKIHGRTINLGRFSSPEGAAAARAAAQSLHGEFARLA